MEQVKSWPERGLVGYVTAYGSSVPPNVTNAMISEAIAQNYDVFVYAFGYIHSNNQVELPSGISEADLKQQIQDIHDNGKLALISFGGANNTFLPSVNNPEEAGRNTAEFCATYNFDGVDLDLEHVEAGVDVNYLLTYIENLRSINQELFLTAAPQIASTASGEAALAPTNIFNEELLTNANFTALLVQEYNQFGGAVFDGLQGTDVGFITASYKELVKIVPAETKIVVGEPANSQAGTGLSNPEDIVKDIEGGGVVLQSPQYGGIMVWAMNYDSEQNWSFTKGVQPVVQISSTASVETV